MRVGRSISCLIRNGNRIRLVRGILCLVRGGGVAWRVGSCVRLARRRFRLLARLWAQDDWQMSPCFMDCQLHRIVLDDVAPLVMAMSPRFQVWMSTVIFVGGILWAGLLCTLKFLFEIAVASTRADLQQKMHQSRLTFGGVFGGWARVDNHFQSYNNSIDNELKPLLNDVLRDEA